jgi:hypothetical protein
VKKEMTMSIRPMSLHLPTGYTGLMTRNLMQQHWLKWGLIVASLVLLQPATGISS